MTFAKTHPCHRITVTRLVLSHDQSMAQIEVEEVSSAFVYGELKCPMTIKDNGLV